jgi:class 3 adenylate cyclase
MGSYQRACEAVVSRHDGLVAQYRGDSLEVYFGYPQAPEDDASRAVRCALEILEAVRQLANATKINLQVRIGIDSGRVVVGTLGNIGRSERVAIGETPNIAARVQAEAAPGEVVISDTLWRLLRGSFGVDPMGARKLKGVDRLVELFKVVASGEQTTGPRTSETSFIGRARERRARDSRGSNVN